MAVDGGVAMSGEVFACPDDPVFSKAADKSAAQQRHHLRVIRERPCSNHRIRSIIVHINIRRKIDIEAECGQFFTDDAACLFRIFYCIVTGRADRHAARHAGSAGQTRDNTSLFIHRHKIGDVRRHFFNLPIVCLQIIDKMIDLFSPCHIASEQDEAAILVFAKSFRQIRHCR